jgi:hypothetical protein
MALAGTYSPLLNEIRGSLGNVPQKLKKFVIKLLIFRIASLLRQ